jgi:hypothetical protein
MTRDLEVRVLCVSRPQRALAKRKAVSREAIAERSVGKVISRSLV